MNCPRCGNTASGKFCAECGAALGGTPCRNCHSPLSAGARFCHACGASASGASGRTGGSPAVPWMVAALAAAVLLVVGVVAMSRRDQPTGPVAPFATSGFAQPAPDISQMTPREQADRLFERIMAASERGDMNEVNFFRSMALDAYALLPELDEDARYHIGLINSVTGNYAGALAQADSIERSAPTHLFAAVLRGEVARAQANQAALRAAQEAFTQRYQAEIASGRPEYDLHSMALDRFRAEIPRN